MSMSLDLGPQLPGTIKTLRTERSVAVIGDIHGRADLLERLLARLPAETVIVVVGDLCDRGSDTRGVIDRLIDVGAIGVRGNHDEWLIAWTQGGPFDPAALSPMLNGLPTLRSYGVEGNTPAEIEPQRERIPEAHRQWLAELALVLDLEVRGERYWVIHAGVPTTVDLKGQRLDQVVPYLAEHHPATLCWSWANPTDTLPVDRPVIMGHAVVKRPLDEGHVIALDTGCGTVPGGRLTAVLLPERRFVTVGP